MMVWFGGLGGALVRWADLGGALARGPRRRMGPGPCGVGGAEIFCVIGPTPTV
jgi:hypothetical protein